LCKHPVPLTKAVEELLPLCVDQTDVEERIASLIQLQLLFTSLDANITGEDYFKRINISGHMGRKHYTISLRKCVTGQYNPRSLKHLDAVIIQLRHSLPQSVNARLQEFINRFRNRFDRQEVPLMIALDPEIGVGYGHMENPVGIDELVLKLDSNKG